ncbi:MAG TPA: RidA family protein [Sphingomicrobium sp.]|jgi:enamine deaminase RidA (YjgF/YER057c/UK114 family)|nr:RidA family protein [Sphingomicrobium sp.]
MKTLLPSGWPRPRGYSNGVAANGRMIFTAGVIGWDQAERFTSDTLPGQFAQVLRNILAILACDGAGPEHIVRMTCYVTDIKEYRANLPEIGRAWQEIVGRHYPAMALVAVTALVEPQALVEIEATAIVPLGSIK